MHAKKHVSIVQIGNGRKGVISLLYCLSFIVNENNAQWFLRYKSCQLLDLVQLNVYGSCKIP